MIGNRPSRPVAVARFRRVGAATRLPLRLMQPCRFLPAPAGDRQVGTAYSTPTRRPGSELRLGPATRPSPWPEEAQAWPATPDFLGEVPPVHARTHADIDTTTSNVWSANLCSASSPDPATGTMRPAGFAM